MADMWGEDEGRPSPLLKVAKTLQGSHAKQLTGNPRLWRDVPASEREIWIRLARLAERLLNEAEAGEGEQAGPAPAPRAKAQKPPPPPAPPPAAPKPTPAAAEATSTVPAPAPKVESKPPAPPRPPQSKATRDALATLLRLKTPPRTEES